MAEQQGRVIMSAAQIQQTLERLAREIVEKTTDSQKLVLVGIHPGGALLAWRLQTIILQNFQFMAPVGTLDITLYRDDWTRLQTRPLLQATDLPFPIDERDVVLVDDVLYTGRTIKVALDALNDYGLPRRVQVAVLVDRGHRELPICAQYIGIQLDTASADRVNVSLAENNGLDQVIVR
jgi:pyrimidine operon attenuation protein/uracil phosphoribosyltransferase